MTSSKKPSDSSAKNNNLYAIAETSGQQFWFEVDKYYDIDRLNAKEKDKLTAFNGERCAAATWHASNGIETLDRTFDRILQATPHPNQEQTLFLRHFVNRLKLEIIERRQRTENQTEHEPLLDLLHGLPGTGKSKVIAWLREIMEDGLGWTHGVQFVFLAFQNVMAAAINGFTLHHWSGIPAHVAEGSGTGCKHTQSIKCQALRVIVIDEVSMISAELLGCFESVIRKVVRSNGSYKFRRWPDVARQNARVFGGINVILCADFWQLKPVGGIYLCSNPLEAVGVARQTLNMFWGTGVDSIRNVWQLTEVVRCREVWYNDFLFKCRYGRLTNDMYCLFHGLPTFTTVRENCQCNWDVVRIPQVGSCKGSWKSAFLRGENMEEVIAASECAECRRARAEKCRVGKKVVQSNDPADALAFSEAPALYNFNVPRYFTILLRAREFARLRNLQISWTYAIDTPLHPEDLDLATDKLNAKRLTWLRRHDQETSNLVSLLPLVVGLPVRLTDTVDRDLGLYRHRRGTIYGWTLDERCVSVDVDGDLLLDVMPTVVYVMFQDACWTIGELPQGVYPLTPKARQWKVNKTTGISAHRRGYCLIADFAATAHMIQGCTLEAACADCEPAFKPATLKVQVAAYVSLSRVRLLKRIYVLQPFSPLLFNRGPPAGPDRLMRKLTGQISSHDAMDEWRQHGNDTNDDEGEASTNPLLIKHFCASCAIQGKSVSWLPVQAFGVANSKEYYPKYVSQGCWTRCLECQAKADARWQPAPQQKTSVSGKTSERKKRIHLLKVLIPFTLFPANRRGQTRGRLIEPRSEKHVRRPEKLSKKIELNMKACLYQCRNEKNNTILLKFA